MKYYRHTKKQYLSILFICFSIISCTKTQQITTTSTKISAQQCPSDAPMFTESVAVSVMNRWADDVHNSKHEDLELSAMHFVANNYANDAVLLPTMSNRIRFGSHEILDYFYNKDNPQHSIHGFMTKHPLELIELPAYIAGARCGSGNFDGNYKFVLENESGIKQTVHARFSFMLQYHSKPEEVSFVYHNQNIVIHRNPGWYIGSHHSSVVPPTE